MVEVFKTNVNDEQTASSLVIALHRDFCEYVVNFDLEDCDRILRIRPLNGQVCAKTVILWLSAKGFWAEQLDDV